MNIAADLVRHGACMVSGQHGSFLGSHAKCSELHPLPFASDATQQGQDEEIPVDDKLPSNSAQHVKCMMAETVLGEQTFYDAHKTCMSMFPWSFLPEPAHRVTPSPYVPGQDAQHAKCMVEGALCSDMSLCAVHKECTASHPLSFGAAPAHRKEPEKWCQKALLHSMVDAAVAKIW
jgi:hypothetical protein